MIEGVTKTGYAYRIEDEVLEDYELLEALEAVTAEEPLAWVRLVRILLGDKGKEELKKHIKKVKGKSRVSHIDMQAEIEDILISNPTTKNL